MRLRRWITWGAVHATLLLGVSSLDVQAAVAPAPVGKASATALRLWTDCVRLTNAARTGAGLAPLVVDVRVAAAAAGQSAYQAQQQTMSHVGAGGSNAGTRLQAQGYSWSTWGENVAAGQGDCASVVGAWLASPSHRANILNRAYVNIGIGNVVGANGVHYWTMDLAAGS